MNSDSLSARQLASLLYTVRKKVAFFDSITGRMRQRYFPSRDPLRRAADQAQAAASALLVEIERLHGRKAEAEKQSESQPY
jgi:hypothetical protein